MSRKDVMTAIYLQDKNRFADLINVYCFHGKAVIRPEDIQEIDSTEIHVHRRKKNLYTSKKYRDLARKVVCGTQFLIVSVEDQSHVDYAMPIRVMGYDANRYEKQLMDRKQEHRGKKDLIGSEFLSGISRDDRFLPVITLVLYFGKHWDGARSLGELLNMDALLPELREFVADYPLYVLEVGSYPHVDRFRTDLRLVFGFLQNADKKEKLRNFAEMERKGLENLAEDAYDLISVLSDTEELKRLKKKNQAGKETVNMCKAIDDMIADARNEGISQGISRGISQGISQGITRGMQEGREELLKELLRKKLARNLDVESIARELEMDVEEVVKMTNELEEYDKE